MWRDTEHAEQREEEGRKKTVIYDGGQCILLSHREKKPFNISCLNLTKTFSYLNLTK